MKETTKRTICILLSFLILLSVSACGDDKKTSCEIHAEEFMNVFLARKYRLVHILSDLSDGYIDSIKHIAADEYIDAVTERMVYTIDHDSVNEKTNRASCNCVLKYPDYEKAYTSSDGTLESFTAVLTEQPIEEYLELKFQLRFRIEEGYWVATKVESLYQDLFVKMNVILVEKKIPVISDDDLNDADLHFIIPADHVTLDTFKDAIKLTGDDAFKDYHDLDTSKSGADKNLLAAAYSADSSTVYEFFSMPSVQTASDYFSDVYNYYDRGKEHEKNIKDNWGFFVAHYEDEAATYWFWFENTIICVETKNEASSKKAIFRFFAALKVTG